MVEKRYNGRKAREEGKESSKGGKGLVNSRLSRG